MNAHSCLCMIMFLILDCIADQSSLFSLSCKWLSLEQEIKKVGYNGNASKCVVCPIMAYAHSVRMYLAFLFQRLSGHWAGESWFTDTAIAMGVITKPSAVYKYELQHHTDLGSLQVNLSHIAAKISPIRQSLMFSCVVAWRLQSQ